MELLTRTLFLCFVLTLTDGAPQGVPTPEHPNIHSSPHDEATEVNFMHPDRCEGLEFDAITPDENGMTFFFKGSHLWKGFHGPAQLSNESFRELDDIHHIGHVDAAFRMHNPDNEGDHDHIYFFLDDKVFSYFNHTLEDGYPKQMQDDFPGVPSHLDAAVECPKGECRSDSVLFFKGHDVYTYDIDTKTVKPKTWPHLPVCTSAFRWLEHYYCFHGHHFTRFHPVTGEVNGSYPKDARNYFMRCPNFGHGHGSKALKCSDVKVDAITSDDTGKSYYFAGSQFMRLDSRRDGLHAFPINRTWREMTSGVDAAFSYIDKIYMIKDDQVFIYKEGAENTLIDGYPKTLKDELNVDGHVDAAFSCPNEDIVYIIQGEKMLSITLTTTPRKVTSEMNIGLNNVDAGQCGSEGIVLFMGSKYLHFPNVQMLTPSLLPLRPLNITSEIMGCQD